MPCAELGLTRVKRDPTRSRRLTPRTGCERLAADMCCLLLIASGLGPRIALALWWIFGNKVDVAFDSWIWPLLGLLFLPWTTIFYALMWSVVGGVSGGEWLLVALGVVFDIATYSARAAKSRYGSY